MVEYRIDENGECYLMEVNGRFWGSLALSIEAGVNFPLALIKNDLQQRALVYSKDLRVAWEMGFFLRFLRIMKGKPRGFPGTFPNRRQGILELMSLFSFKNRWEVLKWTDPLPFLSELVNGIKKI